MKTPLCRLPSYFRAFAFIPLGVVVIGLGACTTQIDAQKVETAISEGIPEQTGLTVESVTCPEGIKAKAGDTFECDVTMKGDQSFKVKVDQENDDGDIRWDAEEGLKSLKGVITNELLEKQITQGIAEQLDVEVTVDCGPAYTILLKDDTSECSATDAQNNSKSVRVVATDDQGNVRWSLKE